MKKLFVCSLSILFLLSACAGRPEQTAQNKSQYSQANSTGTISPTTPLSDTIANTNTTLAESPTTNDANELKALLPGEIGFQWKYFGFAEYAMIVELKSISPSGLAYTAEGAVQDMSGGESKDDFSVKIQYQIAPGLLRQHIEGRKAMDSTYPDIELIRMPLAKGAHWKQTVKNLRGKDVTLSCTITNVTTENGRKVYSITYQDEGSGYYEKREITQGMGVTAFYKLYQYESGSDLIGYHMETTIANTGIAGYEHWLPKLDIQYTYFGLAEYGHKGKLIQKSADDTEILYEYRGIYQDGTGKDDKFVIDYHVDPMRGTITEQVVSNTRSRAEVNSKLHNLVILKFPLSKGERWSHHADLNGKNVVVQATVTDYSEAKGTVKVRYTAQGAEGYYNSTYIEERTFEKGYGLTGFSNLLPGSIGISSANARNPKKLADAIIQHSFGYTVNKALVAINTAGP